MSHNNHPVFAAIQMSSGEDIPGNLAKAEGLIAQAADQGASLVVLPENFACMPKQGKDLVKYAETPGGGIIQEFLHQQSKHHKIWIVGGTIPICGDDPNRVRAASLVFNHKGDQVARYDKIHLFDVTLSESREEYKESDYIEPGSRVIVVATPWGNMGLSVCYDLRFPELYRSMHDQDVQFLVIPSAFTETTGKAHWEVLLRARAIENLCYVFAANQFGRHEAKRSTYGHSMVVDPWGQVQRSLNSGVGVVFGELDSSMESSIRKTFPALSHRRRDL